MPILIPGLPDLPVLRALITNTLKPYNLLGTYTLPNGETDDAIAVEGINTAEDDEEYPPAGTLVEGLEVVITPATDMPIQALLDGYNQFFRHTITLKQRSGSSQTLQAYSLLQTKLGNILEGSAIRQLASSLFSSVEQLSFELEQVVYVPDDGPVPWIEVEEPPDQQPFTGSSFELQFSENDLSVNGVLPVVHSLNSYPSGVFVFNGSGEQITPDLVQALNTQAIAVHLESYRPLQGIWLVSIVI